MYINSHISPLLIHFLDLLQYCLIRATLPRCFWGMTGNSLKIYIISMTSFFQDSSVLTHLWLWSFHAIRNKNAGCKEDKVRVLAVASDKRRVRPS